MTVVADIEDQTELTKIIEFAWKQESLLSFRDHSQPEQALVPALAPNEHVQV